MMITELTFAILKYGFLALLWVFVWLVTRSLRKDIEILSPQKSRAHRRKERLARKAAQVPAPVTVRGGTPAAPSTSQMPVSQTSNSSSSQEPTLLVIIDGPLAGSSIPLTEEAITLGRSASNNVVLEDEFVSSHHARIYRDPNSGTWAIEDLGSTNGTVVNQRRISQPAVLYARVPVRIGATTFELR